MRIHPPTSTPSTHANVAICYRSQHRGPSHIGLGVNGAITGRVLKNHGVVDHVAVIGCRDAGDIAAAIQADPAITHVVVEAFWLSTVAQQNLCVQFPRVEFVVRCHSNFGFLQVEAGAIQLLRDALNYEQIALNFRVAGNSPRFCQEIEQIYGAPCLLLPNLYDPARPHRRHRVPHHHRVLKLASFGAMRLLKLHTTAAASALIAARNRGCDLEFHVNINREEHGKGVLDAIRKMFAGLAWARVVEVPWASWPDFRTTIASMDATIQVSATETHNIVTADSLAEGVPAVGSRAIEWLPEPWKAEMDDASDVARVLNLVLSDPHAGSIGIRALEKYLHDALGAWRDFLDGGRR